MSFKDFDICLENYNGEDARVVIPTGVTKIGEGAFSDNETLRSVVIPEGVRELEEYSFGDCTALEEVTLPASLEEWSWYAFDGCEALRLFHVPAGSWVRQIPDILGIAAVDMDGKPLPPVAVVESEWLYEVHGSEVTVTGRKTGSAGTLYPVEGSTTTLYIPAALEGKSVTAIGENAFADEQEIDALYLPDGLQRIEKGAFAGCVFIELIRIPESLSYIAPGAFYDCQLPEETEERLQAICGYDPDAEPDEEDEEDKCYVRFLSLYEEELDTLGMASEEERELYKLLRAGEKIKAIVYLRSYAPLEASDSPLAWARRKVEEIKETLEL